jgi:hypothetical protein
MESPYIKGHPAFEISENIYLILLEPSLLP